MLGSPGTYDLSHRGLLGLCCGFGKAALVTGLPYRKMVPQLSVGTLHFLSQLQVP